MVDIKETIDGLNEIADSKNDSVCEHLECKKIAENAIKLLKEQQAKIKYLKSEKERLRGQNEALKKKKVIGK